MGRLKTLEEAFDEHAGDGPIFAIAAEPDWPHYDRDDCPEIIRAWLRSHYPHVTIEKLAGLADDYHFAAEGNSRETASQFLPKPIFRLGLTDEEAKHFQCAWSSPPLDTQEAPAQFYFVVCSGVEALEASWLTAGELLVPSRNSGDLTAGE